jgi:hypothetical protein
MEEADDDIEESDGEEAKERNATPERKKMDSPNTPPPKQQINMTSKAPL